jgi:hypothetical protein
VGRAGTAAADRHLFLGCKTDMWSILAFRLFSALAGVCRGATGVVERRAGQPGGIVSDGGQRC